MRQGFHQRPYLSEWLDKALIVLIGLVLLVVMFATSHPIERPFTSERLKRLIAGFHPRRLLRGGCG